MPLEPGSLLILTLGLALGALIGWLATRPAHARLQTTIEKDRAAHAERLRAYQDAESTLREAFQSLSAQALDTNNRRFLDLAETRLREARTEATTDIDTRKKAIEDLLAPLQKTLDQVDRGSRIRAPARRDRRATRRAHRVARRDGAGLRAETARLVDALKRPGVRGRWGELQLKRVVELAGMVEHCDFEEQQTFTNADERRIRPDVVIQLPGGKHVVVDAKVPLDAYLKALEAPDETTRAALLLDHARQVRTHITQLVAKSYHTQFPSSPEFVVMFLPGEMFFSAALGQDPGLIEFGISLSQRVIPASPTTLIALLRAVAYGWQQEAVGENARKINELGRNLYEAVRVLGKHFDSVGTRLKSTLEAYNDAVGSLEGNVLIKARRFKELQAANGGEEIKPLEAIDRVPRMLQASELTDGLPFGETPALDPDEIEEAKPV